MNHMKRWVKRILLVVIIGIVAVSCIQPKYLFLLTATISPEFAVEWIVGWRERMAKATSKQGKINLQKEVVRVEIEDHLYDVPMRYFYWQAFEKLGRWPTAKPGRVKVKALSVSALLPELKPYYPEDDARWKARGQGERVQATITSSFGPQDWFQRYSGRYLNGEAKFYIRGENVYNLISFIPTGRLDEQYFPIDNTVELSISCSKPRKEYKGSFSPGCSVTSNYKSGLVLEYSFGKDYLPNWRDIDLSLKSLFDKFERAAQFDSTTQEK